MGNFKIMLLTDLKLLRAEELLLTSKIFISSFVSNLLYLFRLLTQQRMSPTLSYNDFKAGKAEEGP